MRSRASAPTVEYNHPRCCATARLRVSVVRSVPNRSARSLTRIDPRNFSAASVENCVARRPWARKARSYSRVRARAARRAARHRQPRVASSSWEEVTRYVYLHLVAFSSTVTRPRERGTARHDRGLSIDRAHDTCRHTAAPSPRLPPLHALASRSGGAAGHHFTASLGWLDSPLNARMILTAMAPWRRCTPGPPECLPWAPRSTAAFFSGRSRRFWSIRSCIGGFGA